MEDALNRAVGLFKLKAASKVYSLAMADREIAINHEQKRIRAYNASDKARKNWIGRWKQEILLHDKQEGDQG